MGDRGAKYPRRLNLRDTAEVCFKIGTTGAGVVNSIVNDRHDAIDEVQHLGTGLFRIFLTDGWAELHGFEAHVLGTRDRVVFLSDVALGDRTIDFQVTDLSNNNQDLLSKQIYLRLLLASTANQ